MANNIIGANEVRRLFEQVGRAPAKVLTKATRKGARIVQRAAKTNAPVDEGLLKRSIVLKAEKNKKGKRVYQIVVKSDERFVKISKSGKRSFYPASQEYGWTDQYGHYHPGYRYLRKAADNNQSSVRSVILSVMAEELDRLR